MTRSSARSAVRLLKLVAGADRAPQTPLRYPSVDVLPPINAIRGTLYVGAPTFQRMLFEMWREQWPRGWLVITRPYPLFARHYRALSIDPSLPQAFIGELVPLSMMAYVATCRGGIDATDGRPRAVEYLGVDDSWLGPLGVDLDNEELLGPLPDQARLLPWLAASGVDWPSTIGPSCTELTFRRKRGLSLVQVSRFLHRRRVADRDRIWNELKRKLRALQS